MIPFEDKMSKYYQENKISMHDRSQILFEEAIKSEETRKMYQNCLNMFFKFHNITGDKLLTIPKDEIQTMLEDYVFSRKKMNLTRQSIRGYLHGIKLFLDMNDVVINWVKIKKFLPEASKTSDKRHTQMKILEKF